MENQQGMSLQTAPPLGNLDTLVTTSGHTTPGGKNMTKLIQDYSRWLSLPLVPSRGCGALLQGWSSSVSGGAAPDVSPTPGLPSTPHT